MDQLRVGHDPAGLLQRAEGPQRFSEAAQILPVPGRADVHVGGSARRTVVGARYATHEHVLDTLLV